MAKGGIFFQTADSIDSNALVDAFASLTSADGNLTQQAIQVRKYQYYQLRNYMMNSLTTPCCNTIQLESLGRTITTGDWFNGTFSVDWTVGNGTVITIVYQDTSPKVFIRSPNGTIFNESYFQSDSSKTLTFKIPGTAEVNFY